MAFIQVPPDSTGKKVATTTDGTEQRQIINIGQDASGGSAIAPVDGTNGLAVDAKTLAPDAATQTTLAALNAKVTAVNTGAVVVSSSALPTGAATQTTLAVLAAQVLDYDTGAGTATQAIYGIALPASGGPVAGGTGTNPIRIDPTGTTAQPITDNGGSITIDGTVAATQSGTWTVQPGNTANTTAWKVDGSAVTQPISAASLPLPTGAAAKVAMSVTALQVTASGDTTLVSSGTRKLKRVEASNSSTTTALTVGLKVASLNGGSVFGKKYLPASGGLAVWVFPDDYLQVTSEAITANLSTGGQVEMTAYYE